LFSVTINHNKVGPTDYIIYTEEEANIANIPFKHWQESTEGEYALTDDKYVARLIKKKEYTAKDGRNSYYFRFPFGYIMWDSKYPNKKLNCGGRVTNTTMSGKNWLEVRCNSEDYQDLAFWAAVTENRDVAIDKVYGSVSISKRRKLKRHMRTETFKTMKRDEAQKMLASNMMDADYFIELMKKGVEIALKKEDVNGIRGFVNDGMEIHGMKDKETVTVTDKLEAVQTRALIDNINQEENKLIATRKQEVPIGDSDTKHPVPDKED
tara:strand:- start:305 stop:1102 length:798 start_codon:yes stop_codon:yes gene_type:complete